MYYTYAIYSQEFDKIYIGMTNDLERRLYDHNERGRGWTKQYRPWKIIYFESFEVKSEGLVREKEFKSYQGRQFIRAIIASNNGSVG